MKYFLELLFLLLIPSILLTSCGTPKEVLNYYNMMDVEYQVVPVPIVTQGDTTYINELRFYNLVSARDVQIALYNAYGKWDDMYAGKYNPMINQLVWNKVNLLAQDTEYLLIADGEESGTEYFASVMIFNSENKDVLTQSNPNYTALVDKMVAVMKGIGNREAFYKASRN